LDAAELPLELPHVDKYGPGPEGEGPLANITDWTNVPGGRRETSTMPGYAGSSWYFLRYMDPHNVATFCDRKASDYWNQVDLYIGGTEHAVGHLLYSRLWTKVLFDLGHIGYDEPFKKLVNQGMIQGSSRFVYRMKFSGHKIEDSFKLFESKVLFVSYDLISDGIHIEKGLFALCERLGKRNEYVNSLMSEYNFTHVDINQIHVDVNIVDGVELNVEAFKKWKPEYANAEFILEDSKYICGVETEKMSKSKYNTVNPDELCNKFGADTFRMYEMFLGPVEQSKPWDTKGIEGVHRFLRKLWRLFFDDIKGKVWVDAKASDAELKVLHKTIKKIEEDTERFSFNTAVSTFMICVNELADIKCHKKEVLENVLILLTPYAPHIAEELWSQLGNGGTILDATYPTFNPALLVESSKEYPISINGKVRANLTLSLDLDQAAVEAIIVQNETVQKWLEGKAPKKIIYVKNKMINVVI
jgi:leucyl-tRNA synthetase